MQPTAARLSIPKIGFCGGPDAGTDGLQIPADSISECVVLLDGKMRQVLHHLKRVHRRRGEGTCIDVSLGGVVGPGGGNNCSNQYAKRERHHLTHLIAPFFTDGMTVLAGDVLWSTQAENRFIAEMR